MRRTTAARTIALRILTAGLAGFALAAGAIVPAAAAPTAGSVSDIVIAKEIVVRGVVSPGVEAGCLILRPLLSDPVGGGYLLLGGDRKVLQPGALVEVKGVVERVMTTCQQGTPLRVISARPLG